MPNLDGSLKLSQRYACVCGRMQGIALIPKALCSTMVHRTHKGHTARSLPIGEHTDARHRSHIKPLIQLLGVHRQLLRRPVGYNLLGYLCGPQTRGTAFRCLLLRREAILQGRQNLIDLLIQLLEDSRGQEILVLLLGLLSIVELTIQNHGMQPTIDTNSSTLSLWRAHLTHILTTTLQGLREVLPYLCIRKLRVFRRAIRIQQLRGQRLVYPKIRALLALVLGHISGEEVGILKILFHQETLQILGIHCFGAEAAEIIHIGQAIMNQEGEANSIKYFTRTTFNYPTMAEAYRIASVNGLNRISRERRHFEGKRY